MDDGTVFTANAQAVELSMYRDNLFEQSWFGDSAMISTPWQWTLTANGTSMVREQRETYIAQMHKTRTASEWKCDRCGAVWPRSANRCTACGHYRSVVYE